MKELIQLTPEEYTEMEAESAAEYAERSERLRNPSQEQREILRGLTRG